MAKKSRDKSMKKTGKLEKQAVLQIIRDIGGRNGRSIMQTLLIGFLVPVVLMIVLGIVSYNTAATGMMSKYQESAVSTVSAVGNYFNLICNTLSSKALEIVGTGDVSTYYKQAYSGIVDAGMMNSAQAQLGNAKATNSYIFSYSIIPEKGDYMTSLTGSMTENPHDDFVASTEGKFFQDNSKLRNAWLGYHSYIDANMSNTQPKDYAMAFYQKLSRGDSYLIFDINMSTVEEMLQEMDFGKGSIKALISQDGREIVSIQGRENEELTDTYFTGKDFYEKSKSLETAGSSNVQVNGKQYLYISSPVGQTGAMICALIPRSNLLGQVNTIRYITIFMVVFAAVIAMLIGAVISVGISRTVKTMTEGLAKVAGGDLSSQFESKRKDEFGTLTKSLNKMLTSIRALVQDMQSFGGKVREMASDVSARTEKISSTVHDTTCAMDDMAQGIQSQAEETEVSNEKMIALSDNIGAVTDKTNQMGTSADKAIEAVEQGKVIVQELNGKSDSTVALTRVLVDDIGNVQKSAEEIQSFVEIISSIAEQTNLLSLNASIEAARAGEAGRGFSVVAEEIRKLADQSKESGDKIQNIVSNIDTTTQKTAVSAKKAEAMIMDQAEALDGTVAVFGQIQGCVEELVEGMRMTMERMVELSSEKTQVQESIQNISSISEEASASTEEVTATMNEQAGIISELAVRVEELSREAEELNQSIAQFKLN